MKINRYQILNSLKLILLKTVFVTGLLFISMLIFAFTTGPYYLYHWLGTSGSHYEFKPQNIIIMGGAGYPSESALMRSYYAAELAKANPKAMVFVTQPAADGIPIEETDAYGIKKDLIVRGVDSTKIILEYLGKNTREEALNVIKLEPKTVNQRCVIITSPDHMLRSILTFKKAGFKILGGEATFNASGPVQLEYKDNALGGNQIPLPQVGESIQLRYQFWNHLRYQIICYRELIALGWYKLKGWA
jgi:uncharacterized SAM-binding protein YcdF (DUF218 family)